MRNKQVVRLTESQLRNMISETVKKVLKESDTYQRALNGDFGAWVELGLGGGQDYDRYEAWLRDKRGQGGSSYHNPRAWDQNDGRQYSPEAWG